MLRFLAEGFGLGLSLGTTCLLTCVPVYVPVVLQRERALGETIKALLQLSGGRFISYALVGALAGLAGAAVGRGLEADWFLVASHGLVAAFLLWSAFVQGRREKGVCPAMRFQRHAGSPFIVGLITGISICPGFLGALVRAMDTGGPAGGMTLFIGFFAATTLFFLPLGALSGLTRKKAFRLVGLAASVVAALWFGWLAGSRAWDRLDRLTVDLSRTELWYVNATGSDGPDASVASFFAPDHKLDLAPGALVNLADSLPARATVLLLTSSALDEATAERLSARGHHVVESIGATGEDSVRKLALFLLTTRLEGRRSRGSVWSIPADPAEPG